MRKAVVPILFVFSLVANAQEKVSDTTKTKDIETVVVTALGVKRQAKSLTYSAQQIGGDELSEVKTPNLLNAINGKVSNVQINKTNGVGSSVRVVMRGNKSVANVAPLYVIDGIPMFNGNGGTPDIGQYTNMPDAGDVMSSINPDDIEGEYKGIRTGIDLINGKGTYGKFSQPLAKSAKGDYFSGTEGKLKIFTAAETWFLKSEAALRGYSGAGDAKTNYETGVAQSFGEWGKDGVAAYLNDGVSTQEPYIDPKNPANNILEGDSQLSTITIKWNNADSNERKLERIITQKWLSLYPNGPEAWAEQRRTGYPILFKVRQNDSGGTIDTNAMVRRIPFTNDTKTSTLNYPQAASMLNGPDTGGTRLWWDKK